MVKDEMILIETLKAIEPALKKYFAYDRAMLYKEIESMYLLFTQKDFTVYLMMINT